MLDVIREMLSYPFIVRALVVGVLVSMCSALLGVSLVLKRYSMIGDGLSHVGFGALSIAMVFNLAPLAVAVPVVVLSAFLLLRVSNNSMIKGDAAIAMISSGALAIGVVVISLTKGMNTDIMNYMFGSILSLTNTDAWVSALLAVFVILMCVLLYNRIFAVTFDEDFAKATGTKTGFINSLLAVMTAITVVLGMRMMGTLLISSLIIFPPLPSMRVFKDFKGVVLSSAIVSVVCFVTGMVLSYVFETSSGASVVCVNIIAFAIFVVLGKLLRR